MEHVLAGLQWTVCLLYLDDVIIFSKTFDEHLERLGKVLSRLSEASLKISPKKCHFFQSEVTFLGHVVSKEGVSTDPDKIAAVKNWREPTTVKQLKSFLGFCSYYRRYVQSFANIARPLYKLCDKSSKLLKGWNEKCQESFDKLKQLLTSAPILAYPILGQPYILDTDASSCAIAGVLSQIQDSHERVIAYYSKTLSKSETNYCITRRELLAIIDSVKHFHHYLYGSKVVVRTDHGALSWLFRFKNPEGQLARWLEILSVYDLAVQFRPGRMNSNADGLSRLPCDTCSHCLLKQNFENAQKEKKEDTLTLIRKMQLRSDSDSMDTGELEDTVDASNWLKTISLVEIRECQRADVILKPVIDWLERGLSRPTWSDISHLGKECKFLFAQWERLKIKDNVLYREWHELSGNCRLQIVVPENWKTEILTLLHDNVCAGHLGISKTVARIRSRFYWVGYKDDVIQHCSKCFECQARKMPPRHIKAEMKTYNIGIPVERIEIDILRPLTETNARHKYILVITDCFTKWVEAIPLQSIDASTIAKHFVEQFITRFGIPKEIHTDQGRQFESDLFQSLCSYLKIDKTRTTPFHPQSDGLVERFNRTIADMLSKYIAPSEKDWDELLPFMLMAYRSSEHESTGVTPNLLMFGREVNLPVDLLFGTSSDYSLKQPVNKYLSHLKQNLRSAHEIERDKMLRASAKQKFHYDRSMTLPKFKVKDAVWLRLYTRTKGKSPKLQFRWDGPYKIISIISDATYKIQKNAKSNFKVVHVNKLKPYFGKLSTWFSL